MKFAGQQDSLSINWARDFRVTVSATGSDKAKDVDPFAVMTATGLPIVNRSVYAAGNKLIPYLICREKTAKQNPAKMDQWEVQTAYRSIDKNRAESNNQPIDPPDDITDIAPTEQPSLGEIERVLYEDKASTPKKILLPSGRTFRNRSWSASRRFRYG
ncbi:hypothetical protein [Stieleria mannarensis]|uniref:hypothetical protein n=1 Tax=Stieleria mannarensis TaxID=2755585 RepID=UPI001600C9A9|nr:hypothetical protein [Rhodopirellula sp. JC639]